MSPEKKQTKATRACLKVCRKKHENTCVFKPRAETRPLLMCISSYLSQEAKKIHFTSCFTLKLQNYLTKQWKDLTWNDLTFEQSDHKPNFPFV